MTISNQASGIRTGVCTSTTRPTAPYAGMVIYETDTRQTLVSDGSVWTMLSDADQPPAIQLVKPTSVSSATLSNCTVTIGSAVSSCDILGCFTSEFTNYKISYNSVTTSSEGALLCTPLSGSTPASSGCYGNTFYVATASSNAFSNALVSNQGYGECGSFRNGEANSGVFEIQNPNGAGYTRLQYMNGSSLYWRMGVYNWQNTTQYTGFRFSVSNGTMTGGTLTIHGYRQ